MICLSSAITDIGFFYYNRTEGDIRDRVAKATKAVTDLGITNVSLDGNTIVIKLARPGLLIGRKGETITALTQYLKQSQGDIEGFRVSQDRLFSDLLAFQIALDYA